MKSPTKIQKHDKAMILKGYYYLYLFSPREAVRYLSRNLNSSLLNLCGDTFNNTAILKGYYELSLECLFRSLRCLNQVIRISHQVHLMPNHVVRIWL